MLSKYISGQLHERGDNVYSQKIISTLSYATHVDTRGRDGPILIIFIEPKEQPNGWKFEFFQSYAHTLYYRRLV